MTHEELILKAKEAKSAEELLALAKENGLEMTEENAKAYFEQIHKFGELSDSELDNVSGGGCYANDGRLVTTVANSCDDWTCKHCGKGKVVVHKLLLSGRDWYWDHDCPDFSEKLVCNSCKYMSYERGLWLCNHPNNKER